MTTLLRGSEVKIKKKKIPHDIAYQRYRIAVFTPIHLQTAMGTLLAPSHDATRNIRPSKQRRQGLIVSGR
jgi:hypothetical protein